MRRRTKEVGGGRWFCNQQATHWSGLGPGDLSLVVGCFVLLAAGAALVGVVPVWLQGREFYAAKGLRVVDVEQLVGKPDYTRTREEYVCPVVPHCPEARGTVLVYERLVDNRWHLYLDQNGVVFEVLVFGT